MTELQFERWKDFAKRMARTCYRTSRRPTGKWIEEVVDDFFGCFDAAADYVCIVNWDHSTAYPRGHPYFHREGRLSWCGCDGRRFAGQADPQCGECKGSGLRHAPCEPECVTDRVSDFLYEYEAFDQVECAACRNDSEDDCRCDELTDLAQDQWDEQYGGPIRCCIRAGLDLASEPSAGVVGFTAGDLRRMYPDGVPDWITLPGVKWHHWLSDRVNGTFAEMADSVGVVL